MKTQAPDTELNSSFVGVLDLLSDRVCGGFQATTCLTRGDWRANKVSGWGSCCLLCARLLRTKSSAKEPNDVGQSGTVAT